MRLTLAENVQNKLIPRLHRAKLSGSRSGSHSGLQSRRCTRVHGTFIIKYNKIDHIVVHCSVIVTLQSTYFLD